MIDTMSWLPSFSSLPALSISDITANAASGATEATGLAKTPTSLCPRELLVEESVVANVAELFAVLCAARALRVC